VAHQVHDRALELGQRRGDELIAHVAAETSLLLNVVLIGPGLVILQTIWQIDPPLGRRRTDTERFAGPAPLLSRLGELVPLLCVPPAAARKAEGLAAAAADQELAHLVGDLAPAAMTALARWQVLLDLPDCGAARQLALEVVEFYRQRGVRRLGANRVAGLPDRPLPAADGRAAGHRRDARRVPSRMTTAELVALAIILGVGVGAATAALLEP
jgi:hypothetical protein